MCVLRRHLKGGSASIVAWKSKEEEKGRRPEIERRKDRGREAKRHEDRLCVSLGRGETGLHMRGPFCANLRTASGAEECQVPRDTEAGVIGVQREAKDK